tara:strand:- start:2595 stop:3239 length:645 start_codon:yes stop_codon:yes gene_type:complete
MANKKPAPTKFIGGLVKMGVSLFNMGKVKDAQRQAKDELRSEMDAFRALDTSNPYADIENAFEDLTVNTQEAEFQRDSAQQAQANILGSLKESAGGSGIGSLAQSLANQASIDARRSSASLGAQEAQNQRLSAQGAASVQSQKAQGKYMSQQMEMNKQSTLTGIAQTNMQEANQSLQDNQNMLYEGIGNVAGSLLSGGMMYKGGVGKTRKPSKK